MAEFSHSSGAPIPVPAIDPAATGSLTNTAAVAPPNGVTDADQTNNSSTDTDTLGPTADLGITKADGKTSAVPGTLTPTPSWFPTTDRAR